MGIIITLVGIIGIRNGKVIESRQIELKGSISTKSVNKFFKDVNLLNFHNPEEHNFFECFSNHRKNFPITRITFGKIGGYTRNGGHTYMRNDRTGKITKIDIWDTIQFCGQSFILLKLRPDL